MSVGSSKAPLLKIGVAVTTVGFMMLLAVIWNASNIAKAAGQNNSLETAIISITRPLNTQAAIPIIVTAGNSFSITLPSNRTTGYSWTMIYPPESNLLKSQASQYNAPNASLPGQGGSEVWPFQAIAAGKTTFTLGYVRPWEKNVPPVKQQSFSVVIE